MESRASGSNSGAITINTCKSAACKSDSALKGADPRSVGQVHYVHLQREEPHSELSTDRRLQKQSPVHSSEEGTVQQGAKLRIEVRGAPWPGSGPGRGLQARREPGWGRASGLWVRHHTLRVQSVWLRPGSPSRERTDPAQSQGRSCHTSSDSETTRGLEAEPGDSTDVAPGGRTAEGAGGSGGPKVP